MEYGWESNDVILADGVPFARAARSWFRERAELELGTERWDFEATGSLLGQRQLVGGVAGAERIRATPGGFWQTKWTMSGNGEGLLLAPRGAFSSHLVLFLGTSEIGEVRTAHILTSRPEMTTTEPLRPDVAAFVLWVAYVDSTRRSSD